MGSRGSSGLHLDKSKIRIYFCQICTYSGICLTDSSSPSASFPHFWRSHDGLEVDLIIPIGNRFYPVEIKLTATPTLKHLEPLNRFRALAGEDAAGMGLLVCRTDSRMRLPGNNLVLPWREFPLWLRTELTAK